MDQAPPPNPLKTIFKFLITLLILNAAARGAYAAWQHYQFEDSTRALVLFGSGTTPEDLHDQILELGEGYGLSVFPEDVNVQRTGTRTSAQVAYTQPVELLPRFYYPLDLDFTVEAFAIAGLGK
jgi:hypothetical protein